MEELFVPYDLALILKDKGFNKKCFGIHETFEDGDIFSLLPMPQSVDELPWYKHPAPLYQQVVDWFREKYEIDIVISQDGDVFGEYAYRIYESRYPHTRLGGDGGNWGYYKAFYKAIEYVLNLI